MSDECLRCDSQLLEKEIDEFIAHLTATAKTWLLTEMIRELYMKRHQMLNSLSQCTCVLKHYTERKD